MNPVRSYRDFQQFMSYWNYDGKPIPIVLIKPTVLLYLQRNHNIGEIFDYFNHRTGKSIVFFLPGYAHYPVSSFNEIFSSSTRNPDVDFAFSYKDYRTNQVHRVYYNEKDFTNFLSIIERKTEQFRYDGNTELLFATFVPDICGGMGELDFKSLQHHRYNLTEMYIHGLHTDDHTFALRRIERFLENVRHELERNQTPDEFYSEVDRLYLYAAH